MKDKPSLVVGPGIKLIADPEITFRLNHKQFTAILTAPIPLLEQLLDQLLAEHDDLRLDGQWEVAPSGAPDLEVPEEFGPPQDEWDDGGAAETALDSEDAPPGPIRALIQAIEERCSADPRGRAAGKRAVEHLALHGVLPEAAPSWLRDALSAIRQQVPPEAVSGSPAAIHVRVHGNRVVAHVRRTRAESLILRTSARVSTELANYLRYVQMRREQLVSITELVLEDLQAPFFLQPDLDSAVLMLCPIRLQDLHRLAGPPIDRISKSTLSRLGGLDVDTRFGVFPLALFWQERAGLRRAWVAAAVRSGCTSRTEIRNWIARQVAANKNMGQPSVTRVALMETLQRTSVTDIGNALADLPHELRGPRKRDSRPARRPR